MRIKNVTLYDVDTLDPNDYLDSKVTLRNGEFDVAGCTEEMTKIDPILNM
jgi:hypothetical protein